MKKALITYFSQGGTTLKIAKEISNGLQTKEYETDFYDVTNGTPPDINKYDLIGIGTPVYIFRPPFNIMDYIKSLPWLNGKPFNPDHLLGGFFHFHPLIEFASGE